MKNISEIKNDSTSEIVADIKHTITGSLGDELKEIVLYGSYARDQQKEDSDIDIIVFLDGTTVNLPEIRSKLGDIKVDLSLKYDRVISILVKDYQHYMNHREYVPFYADIYREGVEIYG